MSKNGEGEGRRTDRLEAQDFLNAVDGYAAEDDCLAFVPVGKVAVGV